MHMPYSPLPPFQPSPSVTNLGWAEQKNDAKVYQNYTTSFRIVLHFHFIILQKHTHKSHTNHPILQK